MYIVKLVQHVGKYQKKDLDASHTEHQDLLIQKSIITQPIDDNVNENYAFNSAHHYAQRTCGVCPPYGTAPSLQRCGQRVKSAPCPSNRTRLSA